MGIKRIQFFLLLDELESNVTEVANTGQRGEGKEWI